MVDRPTTLQVLHLDDHLVAVHKPVGLLVHRTRLDYGEEAAALQLVRDQLGRHVYPIHRLDKPTSGVLLFGLSVRAAEIMADLFRRREVTKEYLALVRGWLDGDGVIDYPLTRTRDSRTAGPAREAETAWRALERFEVPAPVSRYATARSTLVRLEPRTGRTHQLRRHMKHVFHPIIGDRKYGDDAHNRFFELAFGSSRLMLTAVRLAFRDPFSDLDLNITGLPAHDFRVAIEALHAFSLATSADRAGNWSIWTGNGPASDSEPAPQTPGPQRPTFQP